MQIDLHADTTFLMHWFGYRFDRRHRPWFPAGAWLSHVDLPRMEAGGLDAQLFGLVSAPVEADPIGTIIGMIDSAAAAARKTDGAFVLVRSAGEIRRARAAGARCGLLSLEGVHPLRGRIERADLLMERGVVSFGLAHFHANEACRPAFGLGRRDDEGLTTFGRDLVVHVGHRGGLIDLAHINRKGFFEAVRHATGPVFVSHTGVSGAHAHWRNIDDEQVRAVADRGGVIGVIFSRGFLGGSGLDALIRHVQHIINVGGESAPALGSDFDGLITPVRGLSDVTGLPRLREALAGAGLSDRVVERVMGENALNLLDRALG